MSRIGRRPIELPSGVLVALSPGRVQVNGPLGELSQAVPARMQIDKTDTEITVTRPTERGEDRALHGLTRTLIANMVEGVTKGYSKQLEITGVGYKAENKPYGLLFSLGYSHTIEVRPPAGVKLTAPQPTVVIVEGPDKEKVGQIAAEIRGLRKPEPYKGKGIKYQGEVIRRKAGKAGAKA